MDPSTNFKTTKLNLYKFWDHLEQVLQVFLFFVIIIWLFKIIVKIQDSWFQNWLLNLGCKMYDFCIEMPITWFYEISIMYLLVFMNFSTKIHSLLLLSSKNSNLVEHFLEYLNSELGFRESMWWAAHRLIFF
jgi:hypothetical protein